MTPLERSGHCGVNESLDAARRKLHEYRVEKLPLVDADGKSPG
jgi:CBS domain-containing protein